ncbi:MAG: hypothetical protein K0R34_2608 [Herbinix sp.]|jgi:hypothetical protein|nr:hypothetical protein [Herbinix sp.]
MKRVIYMALTLASALSLGGCSSAITTKDLTILEEAENQTTKQTPTSVVNDSKDKAVPTAAPILCENTSSAVKKAKELSDLTIEIEGNKEVVSVRNYISNLGYQIMMDEERFALTTTEASDLYSATNPNTSVYPDIYIRITKTEKANQVNYVEDLKQQLLQENPQMKELSDTKINTYDALVFKSNFGTEYNSAIKTVAVIEASTSYYTIETEYFLEAAEGYGARMKALLNTFTFNE